MLHYRLIYLIILLILLTLTGIFLLPDPIVPWSLTDFENIILLKIRIPAIATAIICGSALAISGFILQQLFRNNLAGPYILGVSSGASLAVALAIIASASIPFLGNFISLPIAGFIGALLVLILILGVSARFGNGAIILLFGVIIGQISGAMHGLLSYLANPGELKYFTLWSLGSFSSVLDVDLIIFAFTNFIGIVWAFRLMPSLSVMVLGDDVAGTLGVNTKKVSNSLLACTGLLTGMATAYCGPIAFIGMAIPNASRLLFKTANFRILLLINAILGATMGVFSQIISSLTIINMNIPINVTTALVGGPFIIYILLRNRK